MILGQVDLAEMDESENENERGNENEQDKERVVKQVHVVV